MDQVKKSFRWFQIYYVVQVATNVVFIAYYVVMAFKPRESCVFDKVKADGSKVQEDVSSAITAAFIAGFFLHMINFTICTFIEPCIRLVSLSSPSKDGEKQYSTLNLVGYFSDLAFRLGFLIFSVSQFQTARSPGAAFCK